MSNIKDYVQDLVKNVISTGFFDKIKISANSNDIQIESIDKEREIVLKGKFLNPLSDLNGDFGLSNVDLLGHITSDPEFNNNDSNLTVVYDNNKVPAEFLYENKSKSYINYRFMSTNLLPAQPKFAEPVWDVVIKPTKTNIQQFSWAANGLKSYEQYFVPKIEKGEMKFYIGEANAATQRGGVMFANNLTEKFDSQHKWKIAPIEGVLKLADSADCEIAFSIKGAIQIKVSTGVGEYKFIFLAKVK